MSQRTILLRYSIIINRLQKGPSSFAEIDAALRAASEVYGDELTVSTKTFERYRREMLSSLNIDIRFDFSKKVYYITKEQDSEGTQRLLESFELFNVMKLSAGLSQYVFFEKRSLNGMDSFYSILQAIKSRHCISFAYHKYWSDESHRRLVAPLALKEFKGRWYLLGKEEDGGNPKTFGLDRIKKVEVTKKRFKQPADFDVQALYKDSFGIITSSGQPVERVVLSFDPYQGKYVTSYPLHVSQKVLADNEQETRISLDVKVTYDFLMEILSFGDRVRVLEPLSFQKEIMEVHGKALRYYEKNVIQAIP
ncbi:helix-turn-helix transcriptional regulator [Arcticibacter sp. MXS-1]|uniref:helix-turn-helix transcriptional regulator n=1 Tax=Arcticibacter sp. MXS-1 TaxID=3341726 RepID=UPI0035A9A418